MCVVHWRQVVIDVATRHRLMRVETDTKSRNAHELELSLQPRLPILALYPAAFRADQGTYVVAVGGGDATASFGHSATFDAFGPDVRSISLFDLILLHGPDNRGPLRRWWRRRPSVPTLGCCPIQFEDRAGRRHSSHPRQTMQFRSMTKSTFCAGLPWHRKTLPSLGLRGLGAGGLAFVDWLGGSILYKIGVLNVSNSPAESRGLARHSLIGLQAFE